VFRHTIPIGASLNTYRFGLLLVLDRVLTTWVLAVLAYYPEFKVAQSAEYWLMGAVTAVLFFASIVGTSWPHSWVATPLQEPVAGSPCVIFGGVFPD